MLRRLATLFLTGLLLLTSVGVWLLFPLLQGYYRFKAQHTIESKPSGLITLRLQSSAFKRVGHCEIEYEGLRYDFKNEVIVNDIHQFIAYPDYEETQLIAFFDETWKGIVGTSESQSPINKVIKKMLTTEAIFPRPFSTNFEHLSLKKPCQYFFLAFYSYFFSFHIYSPPEV